MTFFALPGMFKYCARFDYSSRVKFSFSEYSKSSSVSVLLGTAGRTGGCEPSARKNNRGVYAVRGADNKNHSVCPILINTVNNLTTNPWPTRIARYNASIFFFFFHAMLAQQGIYMYPSNSHRCTGSIYFYVAFHTTLAF